MANAQPRSPSSPALPGAKAAAFKYIGKTALTVIGPVSGRRYRFNSPGMLIEVDDRDASALSTVPLLNRVGGGF